MLINRNTKIVGEKVILVPYCKDHVPKYHHWMQSEELLALTCSIPLTLEQEYEMQQSWQVDSDKLTFIVLDRNIYEQTCDEVAAMIGDTNIFILPADPDSDAAAASSVVAEPEIMIAEAPARGKGCGFEAMTIMLSYAAANLDINKFTAKIVQGNSISLRMFDKLGFVQTHINEVFKEVTMELKVDDKVAKALTQQLQATDVKEYRQMNFDN